jgi:hypothetical protein
LNASKKMKNLMCISYVISVTADISLGMLVVVVVVVVW